MDLDLFDSFTESASNVDIDNANIGSVLAKRKSIKEEKSGKEPADEFDTGNAAKSRRVEAESSEYVVTNSVSAMVEVPINASVSTEECAPAKVYKFKLDAFQQEAVNHIERGESVLVAAHTSAGKTAVAEYAIAKSLRDKQRVIYTSPIKALSNQKFRDLQEEFGDVGLMTGDMTLNPHATCLIMTTEILRSMLYRGSEVVREVAWVIYDEVHYMRDKERGVVWEESIILLPHKVRFVFLSATIPNAPSFVSWISKIHHQPCHVVYTDYRPVPLQHYVFPANAEGLYLVVDEKGKFREDNFQKAMAILQPNPMGELSAEGGDKKNRKQLTKSLNNDLMKIINLIMQKNLDPCIIFSFSKKDCESYALKMSSFEFNNAEEKHLVEQVFMNAIEALSEDDKTLPQITTILPLLKRGVGIHHGGLLPILKEVIEILFQEGLIKCLFATETFSIGINMPAKTVVFTKTRKFDGKDFRWITSGEYIQMSGRAGRRGKDDKGIVIQMLDEKMEADTTKNMIYGASDPLHSSYHIGYNMVLNMMRVEGADPEKIIKCSFHQFQQELNAPGLLRQADELEKEAKMIHIQDEEMLDEYNRCVSTLRELRGTMNAIVMRPNHVLPFLQQGRMLLVNYEEVEWGWGTMLQVRKVDGKQMSSQFDADRYIGRLNSYRTPEAAYYVDILIDVVRIASQGGKQDGQLAIAAATKDTREKDKELLIVHVGLEGIADIGAVKLHIPKDNAKQTVRVSIQNALKEVLRRFLPPKGEGVPLLDPIRDIGVNPTDVQEPLEMMRNMQQRLASSRFQAIASNREVFEAYNAKRVLLQEVDKLRKDAKQLQSVTMRDELKKMKKVLHRLEYVNTDNVLSPKGRFSCEVSAGDELVLTNMVFGGLFNELTVEQTVSILSCLVHNEPNNDTSSAPRIRSDMQRPFRQLQTIAREVAKVCIEVRLLTEEQEYVDTFSPAMIDVTYAWVSGAKFSEVCKLTDIFEGSIIRSLRRLEELLRQLASASLAIGNTELVQLFQEGAQKIRRGVVFAASLYI